MVYIVYYISKTILYFAERGTVSKISTYNKAIRRLLCYRILNLSICWRNGDLGRAKISIDNFYNFI